MWSGGSVNEAELRADLLEARDGRQEQIRAALLKALEDPAAATKAAE